METVKPVNQRAAILLFLVGVILGLIFFLFSYRSGFELALYLGIFGPVLFFAPMLKLLQGVHFLRLLLLAVFLMSLISAQMYTMTLSTYPLVAWDMYTRATSADPVYYEVSATFEDGLVEVFPYQTITPLNPRLIQGKVGRTLRRLASAERHGDLENAAEAQAELNELARLFEAKNAGRKILRLDLEQCSIDIKRYTGRDSIQRETLSTYRFE